MVTSESRLLIQLLEIKGIRKTFKMFLSVVLSFFFKYKKVQNQVLMEHLRTQGLLLENDKVHRLKNSY